MKRGKATLPDSTRGVRCRRSFPPAVCTHAGICDLNSNKGFANSAEGKRSTSASHLQPVHTETSKSTKFTPKRTNRSGCSRQNLPSEIPIPALSSRGHNRRAQRRRRRSPRHPSLERDSNRSPVVPEAEFSFSRPQFPRRGQAATNFHLPNPRSWRCFRVCRA